MRTSETPSPPPKKEQGLTESLEDKVATSPCRVLGLQRQGREQLQLGNKPGLSPLCDFVLSLLTQTKMRLELGPCLGNSNRMGWGEA